MFNKFLFQMIFALFVPSVAFCEFVIGIYGVNSPEEIATVKEAGFNCIQTYRLEPEIINAFATEAKKQNIFLIAYPNKIIGGKYEKEAKQYPIKAWYLYDEYDICKTSLDKLIEMDLKTKKTFPDNKTVFVIGEGFTSVPCYDIADIFMVDLYHVPHLPLESLGENVALAKQRLVMSGKDLKPLWVVVQIFNWKEYKQYCNDDDKIGRFSKKDEIKFMSYNAVMDGADGLFYFTYCFKGIPLPKSNPEEWKNVVEVIQEISFMAEVFDNGRKIENPFPVQDPLKAKSFEYGGIKYTILINPTAARQKMPALFFQPKFDVIYEKNTDLKKIIKKWGKTFPPYRAFTFRYE